METFLNKIKRTSSEENECKICYDAYFSQVKKTLPCGHDLCESCASKIMNYRETTICCPFCRQIHPIYCRFLLENECVQKRETLVKEVVVNLLLLFVLIALVIAATVKFMTATANNNVALKTEECPTYTSLYQEVIRQSNGAPPKITEKPGCPSFASLHEEHLRRPLYINPLSENNLNFDALIRSDDFDDDDIDVSLDRYYKKEHFDKSIYSDAGDWFQISYNKDDVSITPYKAVVYKRENSIVNDAYDEALLATLKIFEDLNK